MDEPPDSCEEGTVEVIGGCEVCEDDADCPEGLSCSECFEDCTGNVMRCGVPFGFLECEDGIFRTIDWFCINIRHITLPFFIKIS